MYSEIYNFCKVKNKGSSYENGISTTPRVNFIISLLEKHNIKYELDIFKKHSGNNFFNIILKGNSDKMVVAHHDIVNPNIDNANDNSASVINAIMLKKLAPDLNIVLLDGEEVGGIGSQRLSDQINSGDFGEIKWVLNLELTGKGGEYFFIGNYPGNLFDHIKSLFNCPHYNTPYNDSVTFRKNNIDSVVINPLPILEEGKSNLEYKGKYLNHNILYNCHNVKDSIDTIDVNDMKLFVENILLKIVK